MDKISKDIYIKDSITLSKYLLGKCLVRDDNGKKLIGKIVEVEAYGGVMDRAAHSYGGKRTKRTETMFKEGGCAYVYLIYGMYNCLNVVCSKKDVPEAVLIRGIEPIENIDLFSMNRYGKVFNDLNSYQKRNLSNGPGKLCSAMNITRDLDGEDLLKDKLYILDNKVDDFTIVSAKRIGIDYAKEAKDYLWRFYIKDNKYVSKE